MEKSRRRVPHGADCQVRQIRCYIRDPDGYIIEVGQSTDSRAPLKASSASAGVTSIRAIRMTEHLGLPRPVRHQRRTRETSTPPTLVLRTQRSPATRRRVHAAHGRNRKIELPNSRSPTTPPALSASNSRKVRGTLKS